MAVMPCDAPKPLCRPVSLVHSWRWVLWDVEGLQYAPVSLRLQLSLLDDDKTYQHRLARVSMPLLTWLECLLGRYRVLMLSLRQPVQASQSELDLEKFAASILLEDGPQPQQAQAGLGAARQSESSLQGSSSEWEAMLLDGSCMGTGHGACSAARPGRDADPGSQPGSATGALSSPHWRAEPLKVGGPWTLASVLWGCAACPAQFPSRVRMHVQCSGQALPQVH